MRLAQLLDEGTWAERDGGLVSVDPLGFVDQKAYPDRVAAAQLATGLRDAAVWGTGRIEGTPVAIVVMDFGFMGGSMGAVVGEKVARAAEGALDERIPLVIVSASGGARMQEGTFALMQLAKTMAALERLRMNDVPYISSCPTPRRGHVRELRGAMGDINLAEPNALIGFRRCRVGAGTIGQECRPASSARSSCSSTVRGPGRDPAGAAPRDRPAAALPVPAGGGRPWLSACAIAPATLRPAAVETPAPPVDAKAANWARVQLARNLRRPRTLELLGVMADEFVELHGDRVFGDDEAVVAGFARSAATGWRSSASRRAPTPRRTCAAASACPTRGLPQGDAGHGAGRAQRAAGRDVRRRPGRPPRPRVRGARHRGGDRPQHRPHDPPPHADRHRDHRGGRIGRGLAIAVGDVVLALENAVYP